MDRNGPHRGAAGAHLGIKQKRGTKMTVYQKIGRILIGAAALSAVATAVIYNETAGAGRVRMGGVKLKPCSEAAPDERCSGPAYQARVSTPRPSAPRASASSAGVSASYARQADRRAVEFEACWALNADRNPCACEPHARRYLYFWDGGDRSTLAKTIRMGC